MHFGMYLEGCSPWGFCLAFSTHLRQMMEIMDFFNLDCSTRGAPFCRPELESTYGTQIASWLLGVHIQSTRGNFFLIFDPQPEFVIHPKAQGLLHMEGDWWSCIHIGLKGNKEEYLRVSWRLHEFFAEVLERIMLRKCKRTRRLLHSTQKYSGACWVYIHRPTRGVE